jgi:hypothetical protein
MNFPFAAIPVRVTTQGRITRASILSAPSIGNKKKSSLIEPAVPVLQLNVDSMLHEPTFGMNLVAIDGCDLLFFDVWQGGTCFTNLANMGDPLLMDAMRAWDKAGFIRIELRTLDGEVRVMRQPFKLDKALEKSHLDSTARPNHLAEFKSLFFELLEPGANEALVTARTRRHPTETVMGFWPLSIPRLTSTNWTPKPLACDQRGGGLRVQTSLYMTPS